MFVTVTVTVTVTWTCVSMSSLCVWMKVVCEYVDAEVVVVVAVCVDESCARVRTHVTK